MTQISDDALDAPTEDSAPPDTAERSEATRSADKGDTIEATMAKAHDRVTAARTSDADVARARDKGASIDETVANAYDRIAAGERNAPSAPAPARAPHHWSESDRAEFDRLDPGARAFVLRRHQAMEADYTRKSQELATSRKAADSILAVAKPYQHLIAAEGGTPETAFRALLETAHRLRHGSPAEKSRELQGLAHRFGVDLAHAAGFSAAVAPAQAAALAEVTARQMHVEQQLQREARERSAAVTASRAREVRAFRNAKARDGALMHPHLSEVLPEMAALLGSGRAGSLQEAYDRAVWANPATRQRAAAQSGGPGANLKRAADAKRAARLPKGGIAGALPARGRSVEETMHRVYDRLHGAGSE